MLFPHHPVILSISLVTLKWCNIDIRPQEYVTVGSWALNCTWQRCVGRKLRNPWGSLRTSGVWKIFFCQRDNWWFLLCLKYFIGIWCGCVRLSVYYQLSSCHHLSLNRSLGSAFWAAKTLSRVRQTLKLQSPPALTPQFTRVSISSFTSFFHPQY